MNNEWKFSLPEYVGEMGVRVELFSEPFNQPKPSGGWLTCPCGETLFRYENEAEAQQLEKRFETEGCRCS